MPFARVAQVAQFDNFVWDLGDNPFESANALAALATYLQILATSSMLANALLSRLAWLHLP
jgi:hypothetical protein